MRVGVEVELCIRLASGAGDSEPITDFGPSGIRLGVALC